MSAKRSPRHVADGLKQLTEQSGAERNLQKLHEIHEYHEEMQAQNDELTAAQGAIEETRDRFIELYDFAPNGYLTLDGDGLILRINLTGATLLGKSKSLIEGMPLLGFVVHHDRTELLDFLRRCRAYGQGHGHGHGHGPGVIAELRFHCTDGPRDVQLICRPRSFALEKERYELFAAMIDITERRRHEAERARAFLEHAALARRLLTIQDDERHRIARDLHDNVGQQVTSLRLMLDVIAMADLDEATRARVAQGLSIVERLDQSLDFITAGLRPASLDIGIGAAVEQFVREWSATFGVAAEFHCEGLEGVSLKPDVCTHLYRMVQEALNNVSKHAEATCVSVVLERAGTNLELTIEDDGRGFDANAVVANRRRGLGLLGMKERTQIIGATLEVDTADQQGTKIFLRVPIESIQA